ncbi:hypothetical protein [Microbacterium foliorum]|uniref:hypothetical protein n=1 Tax=Microbacterium foliorum TaxID=104336 RepID=UPI0028D583FD|nr:hypothetical protein [Microbacterium foliorum]
MVAFDSDRVFEWYRADGTEANEYVMSVDDLVTDADELRAAIEAGMRITISAGGGPKGVTSLGFLAPVIAEVRDLWVGTINRVTDVAILEEAVQLRSLTWAVGACAERVDLSALPNLEEFGSSVTRTVASVLQNPSLRFLRVEGAIPPSFARVSGPVEIFEQEGGRSQIDLPAFAMPEVLRSIIRVGPAQFDLGQLVGMTGLSKFALKVCADVIGLSELRRLPDLTEVMFNGCTTRERWEDLPRVPSAFLVDIFPHPATSALSEWREAGWMVWGDPPEMQVEAISVDEAGDGESWGVYMSRFEDLADAVEIFDGRTPGGRHGERFILGVVAELRSEGVKLVPEPDSEGDFTAVYFPDADQAQQVFERAKGLLHVDTETQLKYLRAPARR